MCDLSKTSQKKKEEAFCEKKQRKICFFPIIYLYLQYKRCRHVGWCPLSSVHMPIVTWASDNGHQRR